MNDYLILAGACLALALFGLLFVFIGRKVKERILRFRAKCTSRVYGRVTQLEMRKISSGSSDYTWYPHYEYYIDGEPVSTVGFFGVRKNSLKEGQQVTIFYNPSEPTQAYAQEEPGPNAFNIFGFVGWCFVVCSVLTAIIGIIILH